MKNGATRYVRLPIQDLEEYLEGQGEQLDFGWSISCSVADLSAWSFEVRLTPKTEKIICGIIPDVSTVYYLAGMIDPEEGARKMLPIVREYCEERRKQLATRSKRDEHNP